MKIDDDGEQSVYAVEPEPAWLPELLGLHPLLADADRKTVADWHRPPFRDPTWEPLDEEALERQRGWQLAHPLPLYLRVAELARVLVQSWDQFDDDARRNIFCYLEEILCAGQKACNDQDVLHMRMSMFETMHNLAEQAGEPRLREMWRYLGVESEKRMSEMGKP
ncbi:hypothetical protein ATK36_1970 [Amycolatopsis sulphurea]|uniref:Uncharacterized protein n=1 Tax=Amycolatopsis sulphurea TaxID=76022 RepID=A0A2A9F6J1_9PSEU|nr:hypothetical protein [Amycolatopsis sulphurea]PFG46964.1 hypothetical protein ATK36_1970 [Amycolatopsis sulphurea]